MACRVSPTAYPTIGVGLKRIAHLVLDFDQTVTLHDTLSTLASVSPLDEPVTKFSALTKAYIDDYSAYARNHGPRKTIPQEYAFLYGLQAIERRSIERVEASEIFKGLSSVHWADAANKTKLRDPSGLGGLIQSILTANDHSKVSVVSVNWSREYIRTVLRSQCFQCQPEGTSEDGPHISDDIGVYANQFLTNDQGVTTGKMDRYFGTHGIWTAEDKVRILDDILQQGESNKNDKQGLNIYVGDSITDLAAMLHDKVDYGFVMGDKGENISLLKTCQSLGIMVQERRELRPANIGQQLGPETSFDTPPTNASPTRPLYRIKQWSELYECLKSPGDWQ